MEEINATSDRNDNQTQRNKNDFNDVQLWLTRLLRVLFATWVATRFQETINAKSQKAQADGCERCWLMIQVSLWLCCVEPVATSLYALA